MEGRIFRLLSFASLVSIIALPVSLYLDSFKYGTIYNTFKNIYSEPLTLATVVFSFVSLTLFIYFIIIKAMLGHITPTEFTVAKQSCIYRFITSMIFIGPYGIDSFFFYLFLLAQTLAKAPWYVLQQRSIPVVNSPTSFKNIMTIDIIRPSLLLLSLHLFIIFKFFNITSGEKYNFVVLSCYIDQWVLAIEYFFNMIKVAASCLFASNQYEQMISTSLIINGARSVSILILMIVLLVFQTNRLLLLYILSTINEMIRTLWSVYKKLKVAKASSKFLSSLEHKQDDENECPICLETLHDCKELPCGHRVHENCIKDWSQHQSTCPVCRADFLKAPIASPKPETPKEDEEKPIVLNLPVIVKPGENNFDRLKEAYANAFMTAMAATGKYEAEIKAFEESRRAPPTEEASSVLNNDELKPELEHHPDDHSDRGHESEPLIDTGLISETNTDYYDPEEIRNARLRALRQQ